MGPATLRRAQALGPTHVRGLGAALHIRSSIAAERPRNADSRSRTLTISLVNGGEEAVEVTVRHLAYAESSPQTFKIEPGAADEVTVTTDPADGWYDVEITVTDDSSFRRRLTGHIEDGLPSITG